MELSQWERLATLDALGRRIGQLMTRKRLSNQERNQLHTLRIVRDKLQKEYDDAGPITAFLVGV